MTPEDTQSLYDQVKRAEQVRTETADDLFSAALQLGRYVSDLVADGRLHDPSKLQWLAEYVTVFNECSVAWEHARFEWRTLAALLDAPSADT
jgi:hypothetical protein